MSRPLLPHAGERSTSSYGAWTFLDAGRATQHLSDGLGILPDETGSLLGWNRTPHGWCRGEACIPHPAVSHDCGPEGAVDLDRFAAASGRLVARDHRHRVAAVVASGVAAAARLTCLAVPDIPLTGRFGDQQSLRAATAGRKSAIVLWASWCGCRYDLPAWEQLHRELRPSGFCVVSVALEHRQRDAYEWIDAAQPSHTALVDASGAVAETLNVSNVPTVVWADETGRIVRPPDTMTATDTFREMNGLSSAASTEALRRWVRTGQVGLCEDDVMRWLRLPTEAQQRARAHAALARHFLQAGRPHDAAPHLAEVVELNPADLTTRRGAMRLTGDDPFGAAYFELRSELEQLGVPLYRPLPDWHRASP